MSAMIRVPADRVAPIWPLVRARVAAVGEATREPWAPRHVLDDLLRGAAELWATPTVSTFIIVTIAESAFTRDLHIWIASNEAVERAAAFWPQVLEIARSKGCSRVVWESPRRWERALPGVTVRHLYTAEC